MKNKIKDLQSQIIELDKQIEELVEKNESDKLIGSLELKRTKLMSKVKKLKKQPETVENTETEATPGCEATPMTYKEKLMTLVKNRIETQRNLYFNIDKLAVEEQNMNARQHELAILFDEKIKNASEEEQKRYSSDQKRKFEFQVLVNSDDKTKELFETIQKLKTERTKLEYIDKIQKIDERYLFKLVDLELNYITD